jgi:hypothetical protein
MSNGFNAKAITPKGESLYPALWKCGLFHILRYLDTVLFDKTGTLTDEQPEIKSENFCLATVIKKRKF